MDIGLILIAVKKKIHKTHLFKYFYFLNKQKKDFSPAENIF